MKKHILDIQLMNRPCMRGSNAENNSNYGWFNNRTEALIVVNIVLMREPPDNPTSFVASKRTI